MARTALTNFAGVAALRAHVPLNGVSVFLEYHTTVGDYGGGTFRGVTGGAPGTYVDDGGTIIVPSGGDGSTAWLRDWDGIVAHVGWFGAKCDHVTDDYAAAAAALALFTSGHTAVRTGVLEVGPGFNHSLPLVYGGSTGRALTIRGSSGESRSITNSSYLSYTGPRTLAAIVFYAANEALLEELYIIPGLALNAWLIVADNVIDTTLVGGIASGTLQTVEPVSMTNILVGSFLGIDTGASFEVVRVKAVTATTFSTEFTKNHNAGAQVGGGEASSGCGSRVVRLEGPASPVNTTLSSGVTAGADRVTTPASMTNIAIGTELRIDSLELSETVFVSAVSGSTFTATYTLNHDAAVVITVPTACVLYGNLTTATVQVSELHFEDTAFKGNDATAYAGVRQIGSGNIKNVKITRPIYGTLKVAFAFEGANGPIEIFQPLGSAVTDTLFLQNGGVLLVTSLEDESQATRLIRGSSGSSPLQAVFMSCSFEQKCPADDIIAYYSGQLTVIGGRLENQRTGATYPKFVIPGIDDENATGALTIIGTWLRRVTPATAFIYNGASADMLAAAAAAVTELKLSVTNCMGGESGSLEALPDVRSPNQHTWS